MLYPKAQGFCHNQSRLAPRAPCGAPHNREIFSLFFDFARAHPLILNGRENFSVLGFLQSRNAEAI